MEEHKEDEEGHYITSYLEDEPVAGGDSMDWAEEHNNEPRAFSFLEDFFIRLPQALGMQKRVRSNAFYVRGESWPRVTKMIK